MTGTTARLRALSPLDARTAWVAGADRVVLRTGDGGESWQPALAGETAFAASGTCLAGSGRRYWFTTGGGDRVRVFRTADAGRCWEVADTPVRAAKDAGLFALAFRDADHAVAVGGDYHDQDSPTRALASTSDGGRTWGAPGATLPGYRSGITWTGREYVAVGPNGADVSRDDGATWTPIDAAGFDVVRAAPDGTCWAAGPDGRVARLTVSPPPRPLAAAPRPGPASAPR